MSPCALILEFLQCVYFSRDYVTCFCFPIQMREVQNHGFGILVLVGTLIASILSTEIRKWDLGS